MIFPAEWLAEARYPLLIDPLIQGLLNLATETQEDDQKESQVAYNADDDEYLVVWTDYCNGADNPDIYGQRVSGDGLLAGENFTITTASYRQINPHVAYADGEGVYLVAWRHYPGSSNYYFDVYGQRISRTNELVGNPIPIATRSGWADREAPTDIIYNNNSDQFLVLWSDLRTGYWNVWGRHVSADTGAMGAKIQITFLNSKHESSRVGAYNPDDDQYLIVWEYRSSPGSHRDLRARRMTGSGTVNSGETIYVASGSAQQHYPDAVYLAEAGRYAVVWRDNGSGNYDIYGRLVSPDGALDDHYVIADETQDEHIPRLALDGSGGALAVWARDDGGESGYELYGRRLGSDGQTLSDPRSILEADEDQQWPVAAGDGRGRYLLAWQDNRNGNWDVYGSLYEPEVVRVITYTYDPLGRLVDADYSIGEQFEYAYDAVGNRETLTVAHESQVTHYEYDDANRLTKVGDTTYTWDERGNLTHDGTFTYAYNAAGRMVARFGRQKRGAENVTTTLLYTYTADGLRVAQAMNGFGEPAGEVTSYAWDWASGLPEMLSDGGNLYLVGHDTLGYWDGNEWTYHLPDALGSARQTTNGTGSVMGSREWTPYGMEVGNAQPGLGYTGEWNDPNTELTYLRARWYSSRDGIFLSRDAVERNHPYQYAEANPLKFTDPLGLRGIIPWGQYYWSWGRSFNEYDPDIISDLGNEDDETARGAIHKIELNFEGRPGGPPATILFLLGWLGPCASVSTPGITKFVYRGTLLDFGQVRTAGRN